MQRKRKKKKYDVENKNENAKITNNEKYKSTTQIGYANDITDDL